MSFQRGKVTEKPNFESRDFSPSNPGALRSVKKNPSDIETNLQLTSTPDDQEYLLSRHFRAALRPSSSVIFSNSASSGTSAVFKMLL